MPYGVKKSGSQWVKYKKDTGKIVSHHASKEKAEASIRAYYANKTASVQEHTMDKIAYLRQELVKEAGKLSMLKNLVGKGARATKSAIGKVFKRAPKPRIKAMRVHPTELQVERLSRKAVRKDMIYKKQLIEKARKNSIGEKLWEGGRAGDNGLGRAKMVGLGQYTPTKAQRKSFDMREKAESLMLNRAYIRNAFKK